MFGFLCRKFNEKIHKYFSVNSNTKISLCLECGSPILSTEKKKIMRDKSLNERKRNRHIFLMNLRDEGNRLEEISSPPGSQVNPMKTCRGETSNPNES